MGLDMYLTKKTYVKNWEHQDKNDKHTISVKKGSKKRDDIKPERISYIEEEVMYWRKANAIHNWFVKNVQDGVDNCGDYYLDSDTLQKLVDTCKQALAVIAKADVIVKQVETGWDKNGTMYSDIQTYDCEDEINDILPPTSGFFFGSTDIDKWYEDDLRRTIEVLEEELNNPGSGDYYYHSSW